MSYFEVLKYYSALNEVNSSGVSTNILWVLGFFYDINCKFARTLSIFFNY